MYINLCIFVVCSLTYCMFCLTYCFPHESSHENILSLGIVTRPTEIMKLLSCSSHLSMKFQLLIESKMLKKLDFSFFKLSDFVFILQINVKMSTSLLSMKFFLKVILKLACYNTES